MSDGLPTHEQLRRIERGVQRRIDLRRTVARRVAGSAAAVALLGGGFALVVPLAGGSSGASSAGGSGTAPSAAAASAQVAVQCHASSARDSAVVTRAAPAGASPQRLAEACGATAVDLQSGSSRMPETTSGEAGGSTEDQGDAASSSAAPAPSGAPSLRGEAVPCRAEDGELHVYPSDDRPQSLCTENGMRPA